VWVAICAASLVFQTYQLVGTPANAALVAFVFCATLCSYNFHYLLGSAYQQSDFFANAINHKLSNLLAMMAGLAGALALFTKAAIPGRYLLLSVLLTAAYSLPLYPLKKLAFIRRAGFIKTLLLAFTWMYVTAWLPLAQMGAGLSVLHILLLCKRFLFMLMLCILFDNRDVSVDKIKGLASLATALSPKQLRWLVGIVFILLFILNFMLGNYGLTVGQVVALQLSLLSTLLVYFYALKKQGYIFYYFVVDGMMVLMTLLTTIASI
jgi:hypothetical protein